MEVLVRRGSGGGGGGSSSADACSVVEALAGGSHEGLSEGSTHCVLL